MPEEYPLQHIFESSSLLRRDNCQFMGSHQCIGEPSCRLAILQNSGMNAIEQFGVLRDPDRDFDARNRAVGISIQIKEMDFMTGRAEVAI